MSNQYFKLSAQSVLSIPSRIILCCLRVKCQLRYKPFNSIKDYLFQDSVYNHPHYHLLSIPSRIIKVTLSMMQTRHYPQSFNSIKDYLITHPKPRTQVRNAFNSIKDYPCCYRISIDYFVNCFQFHQGLSRGGGRMKKTKKNAFNSIKDYPVQGGYRITKGIKTPFNSIKDYQKNKKQQKAIS